jgi:hypothetical protein
MKKPLHRSIDGSRLINLSQQSLLNLSQRHSPWYIHLRPATTDYDKSMRPPAAVWLYPYNPGTLHMGRSRPKTTGAWSGTLADKKFLGSWRTCCGGNRLARQSAFLRY